MKYKKDSHGICYLLILSFCFVFCVFFFLIDIFYYWQKNIREVFLRSYSAPVLPTMSHQTKKYTLS